MSNVPFIKRLKEKDPTFMPDQTPEQIATAIQDPAAAGAFYETLKQRYPNAMDMERDAFIEKTTGKKPRKVIPNAERIKRIATVVKTKKPDFMGNVSADQLTKSWVDSGDTEKIYRDLSGIDGFMDMSYAAFEEVMSAEDKHDPVKPEPEQASPRSMDPRAHIFNWMKGDAPKKREIKEVEKFTGTESPLGWGIRKMGNYEDRMSLYDANADLNEKGRVRIGNEAIGLFENAAGDAIAANRETYDKEKGDGAFDEIMNDYTTMLTIASMNPDKEKAQREIEVWVKENQHRVGDERVKNAMNAMSGMAKAQQDRRALMKQNPKAAKEILEKEAESFYIDPISKWVGANAGRALLAVAGLTRSDHLNQVGEWAVETYARDNERAAFENYLEDKDGNRVVVDGKTRQFMYALDKDDNVIEDYAPDTDLENKLRTQALNTNFNGTAVLNQTADVLGDLLIDAFVTKGATTWARAAGAGAKLAGSIGIVSAGYLRAQDAAMRTALESGRTSEEAYLDQMVKGLMIGATSLINPLEGQVASRIFGNSTASALRGAMGRYSVGKVTWLDMLSELSAGATKSAGGEVIEEVVQDHILDRGYNTLVYGHDFDLNRDEIAETVMVSGLVGLLGGSAANIDAFSKTGLMKRSINSILNNPDLVEQYLAGVRKVDPELADQKAEKIAQLTKQIQTLKPSQNVIDKVAAALIGRNKIVDDINALGKDIPAVVKTRLEEGLARYDASIDALLTSGKAPKTDSATPSESETPTEEQPAAEEAPVPKTTKGPAKTYEELVKEDTSEPAEGAYSLKQSKKATDVQTYEDWRVKSLDKKAKDLKPEEAQAFGKDLDPEKTVREQLGDDAGIPTIAPAPMPKDASTLDKILTNKAGFQTRKQEEKTKDNKTVYKPKVLLTRINASDKGTIIYGDNIVDDKTGKSEHDVAMEQMLEALEETRNEGGTVEDFHKKLKNKNIQINYGQDARGKFGMSNKKYQDAVFASFLNYKRPPTPKVQSLEMDSVTYTYNKDESQWEGPDGKKVGGIVKKKIERKLAAEPKATKKAKAKAPKLSTVKVDLATLSISELENVAKQLRQKSVNARQAEKEGKPVIGGSAFIESDYQAVKKYIAELKAEETTTKKAEPKAGKKETEAATELEKRAREAERDGLPQLAAALRKMANPEKEAASSTEEEAARDLHKSVVKELGKSENITGEQASTLASAITAIATNIAKRLGISLEQYSQKLSIGDITSTIFSTKNSPDVTSPVNEIFSEYEKTLTEAELTTLEEWSGHKRGTTEFKEAFTKGGEKYIYEGSVGNSDIDGIFAQLKEWFVQVVQAAEKYFGSINELNNDVRQIYAAALAVDTLMLRSPVVPMAEPTTTKKQNIAKTATELNAPEPAKRKPGRQPAASIPKKEQAENAAEALPKDVLSRIDEYVTRAVENDTPVFIKDIFPEGIPAGVTEATVQVRYLRALRANKPAMLKKLEENMQGKYPVDKATPEQLSDLKKVQERRVETPKPKSAFDLSRLARRLKGEQKKAVEIIQKVNRAFRKSGYTIYVHETIEDFANGIGISTPFIGTIEELATTASGIYHDGRIHIFIGAKDFDANVALHEAVHPLLLEAMDTYPELRNQFLKELVSDPDLFSKYWVDFSWDNYAKGQVPKTPEEAAELLDTLDTEALTEMLASETMRKLMEGLPKQKKSIREKIQKFLTDILEQLGFTGAARGLYRIMEPNAVFDGFFDNIKDVDSFATQFAKALERGESIPLRKLHTSTAGLYASKQSGFEQERMDDLYAELDDLFQIFGTSLTLRDALLALSNHVAAGIYTRKEIEIAYEETVFGHYRGRYAEDYMAMEDIKVLRGLKKQDIAYNKTNLEKLSDVVFEKYIAGEMTSDDLNALAANTPEMTGPAAAYNTARQVIEGEIEVLSAHRERAMAYQMYVLEQNITKLAAEIDRTTEIDPYYAMDPASTTAESMSSMHMQLYGMETMFADIRTAIMMSGTAHGRALAFRREALATPMTSLETRNAARFKAKMSKSKQAEVDSVLNRMGLLETKLNRLLTEGKDKTTNAVKLYVWNAISDKARKGEHIAMSLQAFVSKYSQRTKPSASLKTPFFLTIDPTTIDQRLFFNDLKDVVMTFAYNQPDLTLDEIVGKVVTAANNAGIPVIDEDIYAAILLNSKEAAEESITEYQAWKRDTQKTARAAAELAQLVQDIGVQVKDRIKKFKQRQNDEKAAVRTSDLYISTEARRMEHANVKQLLDRIKAQAAAFEMAPSEFQWILENIQFIETQFHDMFNFDSPIDEDKLTKMLANARNLISYEKLGRLEKAHAEVDAKIAALRGATTEREKYLALTGLIPAVKTKYAGQTVLDKKYVDPEVAKVRRELEDKRREIKKIVDEFKRDEENAFLRHTRLLFSTLRTIKTTFDNSGTLNQGGPALRILITTKEGRAILKKAYFTALKAGKQEAFGKAGERNRLTRESYDRVLSNPLYNIAKMSSISFTQAGDAIGTEEFYQESYFDVLDRALKGTENIPGKVAQHVSGSLLRIKDASETLYVTYLNDLRMYMFEQYYNHAIKNGRVVTDEELQIVAEAINTWTGRSSKFLGITVNPAISAFLWAPRYYAAQIKNVLFMFTTPTRLAFESLALSGRSPKLLGKVINGKFKRDEALYGVEVATQRLRGRHEAHKYRMRQMVRQAAAFGSQQAAIYATMKGLCGDQGGMGLDFTKSTFLKFQCGTAVFDMSSGFSWWMKFGFQMQDRWEHAYNKESGTSEGFYGRQNAWDILGRAINGKLNPVVSYTKAILTNEDYRGMPYGATFTEAMWELAKEVVQPITVSGAISMIKAIAASDNKIEKSLLAVPIMAFVLHGMNYYEADNNMSNLLVDGYIDELNSQSEGDTAGSPKLKLTPKPPSQFTKSKNPTVYAEYKQEYNARISAFILEQLNAGIEPPPSAIKIASDKINKSLAKEFEDKY